MKRKLLILIGLCLPFFGFSQKNKPVRDYKQSAQKSLKIPGTAFLFPSENNDNAVKFDYKQMNAPLPAFKAINYKGEDITSSLLNGSNLIVMCFNPTCEHCEDQAQSFKDNIFLFKNSKILLIAADIMTSYLEYFNNGLHLSEYPTITVSVDSAGVLNKIFNYEGLPQLNIYSGKDLRLLRTFNNGTPIDTLKQYIQ